MVPEAEFSRLCKVNGLPLTNGQLLLLRQYVGHLLEWNRRINLISRKDEQGVWISHILHSVAVLFHVHFPVSAAVMDLGTGGGLPGIPIAIARPDLSVTLLDSIAKKTAALQDIIARLGVSNVEVICARAEALRFDKSTDRGFDIVLARAVAPLRELVQWALRLASPPSSAINDSETHTGSHDKSSFRTPFLLAMKGGNVNDEIRAARMKYNKKNIVSISLRIDGLRDEDLVDKKLILVEL